MPSHTPRPTQRDQNRRTRARDDWRWEDFRPEWANEGLERIGAEL